MQALLARSDEAGIETIYDSRVTNLIVDDGGRVVGVRAVQAGRTLDIRARRAVILATGSFNASESMVRENISRLSETARPIGIPYNDGSGIELARSAGAAQRGMGGIIATASIYPPEQLVKGVIVNSRGERFVAEDVYHGRLASFIQDQPDQRAFLLVDSDIFAYPDTASSSGHHLVDGWDTVSEMEAGLDIPPGRLAETISDYNRDMAQGVDRRFRKQAAWLKPLDAPPYAAFDISFNRSIYSFLTLGGLSTNAAGQALSEDGTPVPGLFAVGACAAQFSRDGKEYASGITLGTGSFFGRQAGRAAAQG